MPSNFAPTHICDSHDVYGDDYDDMVSYDILPQYIHENDNIEIRWPCGSITKHTVHLRGEVAHIYLPMSTVFIPVAVRLIPKILIRKCA